MHRDTYRILSLAGRCSNGFERDHGRIQHAVPPASNRALCGATYGRTSAGWSSTEGERVTCGRCITKIEKAQGHEHAIGVFALTMLALLVIAPDAHAQISPWERAASNLELSFTGPIARSLALVAIVVGGLMWRAGEGGSRTLANIVFGGGIALFAAQFLVWLF